MNHVVVVADSRFPIGQPFVGGMQSLTWHLVRGLRRRGTDVSVFAAPGSDPALGYLPLLPEPLHLSETARNDVSAQPEEWLSQHHAYLDLMLRLADRRDVDVVHNNSLHHLPVAMSTVVPAPVLTTLHTPPTPWLESAVAINRAPHHFAAVSRHTQQMWQHVADASVVLNGVDTEAWPLGPGGDHLVWSGRLVPEKAPHLAIEVARAAGRPLRLAGPVADPAYFRSEVEPRLGGEVSYVGHLRQDHLAELVGASAACLVTPTWDEPYGLVAAEALSCGTPVVGFARGGLPEVVDESSARLVPADDVAAAAESVVEAIGLPRRQVRERAVEHCSVDTMVEAYLRLYADLTWQHAA